MPSAAVRFYSNPDVLGALIEHVDKEALYPLLQVSKLFAASTLPRLYRVLPVRPNQPSTFLDLSIADQPCESWSKRSAWEHVRTLDNHTHGQDFCPGFTLEQLPHLPNLHTIHLAGGDRSVNMGKECQPHSCPLLARYSKHPIEHLIIRKLHLLPSLPVRRLTIILRPCQFPFDPHGKATYSPATFSRLDNLVECDVVLWDEKHDHRLEWIYHPPTTSSIPGVQSAKTPMACKMGENSGGYMRAGHQVSRTRGCGYCDMQGCVRYTPNLPKQLPGIAFTLARVTWVTRLRVWNVDRSMRMFQWYDSTMTVEEGKEAVRKDAQRGREERVRAQQEAQDSSQRDGRNDVPAVEAHSARKDTRNGRGEILGGPRSNTVPSITVDFGNAQQWLYKLQEEGRIDQMKGEETYWELLNELNELNEQASSTEESEDA